METNQELPIADLQLSETQPSLLARMANAVIHVGEMARDAWEIARHNLKTYAAVGAAAFTAAQAAELAVNADPLTGAQALSLMNNNPAHHPRIGLSNNRPVAEHPSETVGSAENQVTADPALQECISFNLSQPQLRWASLRRNVKVGYTSIGQPHNKLVPAYYQFMDFESWVAANPCPDEVSRQYEFAAFFQSRNPRHRDRYFKVEPYANSGFSYNGADVFNTAGGIQIRTYPKPIYKREIYKCYPGKGVEHVQGRFRKTVYDPNTRQQLAQEIIKFPIEVDHPC